MSDRPSPPPPAPAQACAWSCDAPSRGWRWVRGLREWARACRTHRGRPADFVDDNAPRHDQGDDHTPEIHQEELWT